MSALLSITCVTVSVYSLTLLPALLLMLPLRVRRKKTLAVDRQADGHYYPV